MIAVKVNLPDELARRAEDAGLLTDRAIQHLLEEAIRRDAGHRLLAMGERLQKAAIEPMSDEELVAEVKALRAKRSAN